MFSAVVFNLFGTLVPPVDRVMYRRAARDVAAALEVNPALLFRLWLTDEAFTRRVMTGGSSTMAQMAGTCEALGVSRSAAQYERAAAAHLDHHRAWLRPWPDSVGTLRHLREGGLRIGLISNCSISVPELWDKTTFASLVDCALFSCVEGVEKPAASLYERAWRALGVAAAQCLYVGDGLEELGGARAAGMTPVWLASETKASRPSAWTGLRVASPTGVLPLVSRPDGQ